MMLMMLAVLRLALAWAAADANDARCLGLPLARAAADDARCSGACGSRCGS